MSTSPARPVSLVLLVALTAATGGNAMAQRQDDHDRHERPQRGQHDDLPRPSRDHDRREDHRALSDAVRRVERRSGGQVLSAERVPFDGRSVNRVKVIDASGRVRVYMDDPRRRADHRRDDDDDGRTRRDDD